MALISVSNNALQNITAVPASIPTGALILIKSITASASASISFVDGTDGVVLDSTYSSYIFKFINCHPASNNINFQFNLSTDSGSNYNVTKTSTFFMAGHAEADNDSYLEYISSYDLAQSTAYQPLAYTLGNASDENLSGSMQLFNPASTTYVKHFITNTNQNANSSNALNTYVAGYGNTTSAVNAVQFRMSSGNIDDGIIKLYGVK